MTREEAIKELERISEDTVQRECSTCGRLHIGTYSGICALCSLCEYVPDYAKEYHKKYQIVSRWKWNKRWKTEALDMAIAALREQDATDTNVGHKTNADHIRHMSDEELADYMSEHSIEDFCYIICGGECKAVATFNKTSGQRCREIVADWLKQPYKEDT